MLKRIAPTDVVLGMYIHKFEGSWFSHPFWRANFLVDTEEKLEKLRESDVSGVIIDTEIGLDPDAVSPAAASPPAPTRRIVPNPAPRTAAPLHSPPPPPPPRPATPPPARGRVLTAAPGEVTRGFGKAQAVADRGLKVISNVFLEMRLGKAIKAEAVTPVIESIMASVQSNPGALNGLMRVQRENQQVYRHAMATSALMIALGRELRLGSIDLHAAGLAGMLLDSGIARLAQGDAERDPRSLPETVWQSHVRLGHELIASSGLSDSIARACLEHHERHDGTGFPNRVGGSSLSLLGRMAAICDAFDLMVAGNAMQPALDPAQALRWMKSDVGAYDPEVFAAFEASVGMWPTGSTVELRSGRLAVVIDQRLDAPDRPLVGVFFNPETGDAIDNLYIDLKDCYGADAIERAGLISALPPAHQSAAYSAMQHVLDRAMFGPKAARRGQAA